MSGEAKISGSRCTVSPDPSPSLPPEMVEAIRGELRDDIVWLDGKTIQRITDAAVAALAPQLAERDLEAGCEQGAAYDKQAWSKRRAELAAAQAEARRLREALEADGHGEGGGFHRGDMLLVRGCPGCAALSASPVTEASDSGIDSPTPPTGPEQAGPLSAQDRADLAAIFDHYLYATRWVDSADPKPHEADGVNGLKARRALARRLESEQFAAIVARPLRELLTSDEAVEAANAGWRAATGPALAGARASLTERGFADCIRDEQMRGALAAVADTLNREERAGA